ncbi:MAG: [protein-PII] uridylyltransferase [Burkholderiaceae bacterium]|nr:[protein-PII] uridylyltransferase [Burkholderiaceae bacterium]
MATLAQQLKQRLNAGRQEAVALFEASGRPTQLLTRLRQNVDAALTEAWEAAGIRGKHALIAVGGYGRGELFPYSDIDLLILLEEPPDQFLCAQLENLVTLLWDLGLDIGHSIRTVDECVVESAADITIQTALLEARIICGNRRLFKTLQERYREQMDASAFFQAKTLEMRQRHVKYEDTPYSLEPNCKESPGGLRDLQVILWIAKAARLGKTWRGLAKSGLITATEARQLTTCERAFKELRIRLHIQAGRREDRLVFDLQTPIAASMGFKSSGNGPNATRAAEVMMQRYYRAAKAVTQLNTILLQNIEVQLFPQPFEPHPINARFNEVNGLLDIVADDTYIKTPSATLETFLLLAQNPELNGMTARTLRAVWHARLRIDDTFRRDPGNCALFLLIMQAPRGVTHALRQMNQTSVLGRYLPNFRRIVGQMQHDLFHIYTVDQHILTVVHNVRRFALPEHAHEFPFCSQLMANFSRPWLLYIAALLHDIAKGRGGDHSQLGMEDARQFCRQHRLNDDDAGLVVFLVGQHLTMSHVAQKKDLSDTGTIRDFAVLVGNERRLTALYLLTVADIRATSPQVWNAWKGKLLEDLYRLTLRVLGGETLSVDNELKNKQKEAIKTLRLYGLPPNAHEQLWTQLDVGYFLRHDASDIAWQTRNLYFRMNSDKLVVKCRLSPIGEGLQVVVYVKDQPDLFARICGYFDRQNYSILDAKIHTTKHGYALDTFLVTRQIFEKNYRDIISLVEHDLAEWLSVPGPLPPPTKGIISRMSRAFPITPTVDLRPDARGEYHVLSVTANDRTGLLYSIANVLAKYRINLHTAKIMTMGERVEDVFLVEGEALENARTQIQLETDLLEALRI